MAERPLYFPDLGTSCQIGEGPDVRAVGWLDKAHPYPRGAVPAGFYTKLKEFADDPLQPILFFGCHECELCFWRRYAECKNLWIPAARVIYLAPAMITHYIKRHRYKPPEEFVEAVFRCPRQGSPEFMGSMRPYMHYWRPKPVGER